MLPAEQSITRTIGDEWVRRQSSAVLSVPSVIVGERNFVLNPAHKDYAAIVFSTPQPFELDTRLLAERGRIKTM
jgi:RES domain-containing protein